MKGQVLRWLPERGFGFVRLEDGREAFLHEKAVRPTQYPRAELRGEVVSFASFAVSEGPKGLRLEEVTLTRQQAWMRENLEKAGGFHGPENGWVTFTFADTPDFKFGKVNLEVTEANWPRVRSAIEANLTRSGWERSMVEQYLRELEAQALPLPPDATVVGYGRNTSGFAELKKELATIEGVLIRTRPSGVGGRKMEEGVRIYATPAAAAKASAVLLEWEPPRKASWNGGRWRRRDP